MLSQLIANALVFLPLVFNNGAATPPAVVGDGPTEPKHIVRYEAERVDTLADGSFTALVDGNLYGGCLETVEYVGGFPEGAIPSECSQSLGYSDNITLFEDGSAIWFISDEMEIDGCFLPDWGCSPSSSRSWIARNR